MSSGCLLRGGGGGCERNTMLHPLGGSLFAYVKTRQKEVKIHIRHYAEPTNTKGGRVVPTNKGVTMDYKCFQRLFKMKKNLKEEFDRQVATLPTTTRQRRKKCPRLPTHTLPDQPKLEADGDTLILPPEEEAGEARLQQVRQRQQQPQQLKSCLTSPSLCPSYCPNSINFRLDAMEEIVDGT